MGVTITLRLRWKHQIQDLNTIKISFCQNTSITDSRSKREVALPTTWGFLITVPVEPPRASHILLKPVFLLILNTIRSYFHIFVYATPLWWISKYDHNFFPPWYAHVFALRLYCFSTIDGIYFLYSGLSLWLPVEGGIDHIMQLCFWFMGIYRNTTRRMLTNVNSCYIWATDFVAIFAFLTLVYI